MALKINITDLPPPILEFGGSGGFTDPKVGLVKEGPFSLRFGPAHKSQVRLGLIGPREIVDQARAWFRKCKKAIASNKVNQEMYPSFPGFQDAFRASLDLDPRRWQVILDDHEIRDILKSSPRERFQGILNLYSKGIERFARAEVRPDVTVCCLTKDIVRECRTVTSSLTTDEWEQLKEKQKDRAKDQVSEYEDWSTEETAEDLLYRDFRRALKARAMKYSMPIQIGRTSLFIDDDANQDAATRAWNVSVALFYKAGGIPWRLKTDGPETCFVGVSFHHLKTTQRHLVYSSVAQAFSTDGDGFALRGDAVPWSASHGRNPHLSSRQAAKIASEILTEYRERIGHDPARIVLHKTSKFNADERAGFLSEFRQIPIIELVNLMPTQFRLVNVGAYPPKRGTLCQVNEIAHYLFTNGYMPEWGTYPGAHIPVPVQIIADQGADIERIATDVLGLSRMNWNTARDTSGRPITLRFAREVGGIMAEVGPLDKPNPSYRYYM